MEQIQQANKRLDAFRALDTEIVAISKDSQETIRRYKDSGSLGLQLLSDPSFATARRYQSYDDFEEIELHSTVLIDKQGRVHWSKHGGPPFTDFDFLESELKQLRRSESLARDKAAPPDSARSGASNQRPST
jgi:peroxiredoxin